MTPKISPVEGKWALHGRIVFSRKVGMQSKKERVWLSLCTYTPPIFVDESFKVNQ